MSEFISLCTPQPASSHFAAKAVVSAGKGAEERLPLDDGKPSLSGREVEGQGTPDTDSHPHGNDNSNGFFGKILSDIDSAQVASGNNTSEISSPDKIAASLAYLGERAITDVTGYASEVNGDAALQDVAAFRGEASLIAEDIVSENGAGATLQDVPEVIHEGVKGSGAGEAVLQNPQGAVVPGKDGGALPIDEVLNGIKEVGHSRLETPVPQTQQMNGQPLGNEALSSNPELQETELSEQPLVQQEASKAGDKSVETRRQEGLADLPAKEPLQPLNKAVGETLKEKGAHQEDHQPFSERQWGNKSQGEWFYKLSESTPEEPIDAGRNPLSFQAASSSKAAPSGDSALPASPDTIIPEGKEGSASLAGSDDRAAAADSRPEPMARAPRSHLFSREDASPARFQFNTTRALNAFKHQIDLKIHDADFGRMHWRVNMEGGKIAADVVVETSRVQELIQNNQESLQSRINDMGMGMKNLDVAVNHGSQQNLAGSKGRNTKGGQKNSRPVVDSIAPEKVDMPARSPLNSHHNEGLSLYI